MEVNLTASFDEFVNAVKIGNKKMICFGVGLISHSIEDMLTKFDLDKNLYCFADGNPKKQGTTVDYCGKKLPVISPSEMAGTELSDTVLLLTLDVFGAVIESLGKFEQFRKLTCYAYPALNLSYIKKIQQEFMNIPEPTGSVKIPKAIHYCRFGGGQKPKFMTECIDSWRKTNPAFEIVEWNEQNYDVRQCKYTEQAYDAGKFAFVSDLARLDILYRYGGIYLDTDVVLLRRLDELLYNKAFIAYNEWAVPNSAICGCEPSNEIFREMREDPRGHIEFLAPDGRHNLTNNSFYESKVLQKYGFKRDFTYQVINGVAVYPPCYFPQKGKLGFNSEITEKTYAVHYAVGSWADSERTKDINVTQHYLRSRIANA
jgi:hypothetical protein